MRIAIIAAGSRGDVQPPAGLAAALAACGHEPRLVAPPEFASLAAPGVDFVPLPIDIRAELASGPSSAMFERGGNPLVFIRHFVELSRRLALDMTIACRDATKDCDVVVGTGLSVYAAACVAEYWKVPCVHAFLQPMIASRDFPSPVAPVPSFRMPGWMNRMQHKALAGAIWFPMRFIANSVVRKTLALPPSPLALPIEVAAARGESVAMAYSRHLLPRGSEWPANVVVTGFWFLDAPRDWAPPRDLQRFLDEGEPPVYVGFGSMGMKDPRATLDAALGAIATARCRAVIGTGWGGLRDDNLPAHVFAIDEAPHDWLFPRMAAVVHHGGAGTTGAALRAGKPSVVVPFLLDQFFWGARLKDIGVAPPPIPHRKLTAAKLGAALKDVLANDAMRARAEKIGEAVRLEDGLGHAIAMIESAATAPLPR